MIISPKEFGTNLVGKNPATPRTPILTIYLKWIGIKNM